MKNIVVLNIVALVVTFLSSACNSRETIYIGVYLYEIITNILLYKHNSKNIDKLYFKNNKWLFMLIFGLLISNILVVIFHDAVKWIARPFFWLLSILYIILLFFYAHAFVKGKAKLSECFIMITTIIILLLTSLPVYRYYRLSYSAKYKNNVLVYKHYADATYEETLVYCADSLRYVKNINQENKIVTIYYNSYPTKISHIDTTFINK